MHMNFPVQLWGNFGVTYVIVIAMVSFIQHLILAIGVYTESSFRAQRGRKLWFIGPFLQAFVTFVSGIFTAAIYWAMHHSTLTPMEAGWTRRCFERLGCATTGDDRRHAHLSNLPVPASPRHPKRCLSHPAVFQPIPEVPAGKTLTYQVKVKGTLSGNMRFRTKVSSDSLVEPLASEELTKIYGE